MNRERIIALCELMARPDPDDLRRVHRITQEGKPGRFQLLAWLPNAYVNQRRQDLEDERTA